MMKRYNKHNYNRALSFLELERENYEGCFTSDGAFTRNRKMPLEELVKVLLTNAGTSLSQQLRIAEGLGLCRVTSSAFIQQRSKLRPVFFHKLFENCEKLFAEKDFERYKGYIVIACDGSDVHIPRNPDDPNTLIHNNKETLVANMVHLNALTVEPAGIFIDYVIQDSNAQHEQRACIEMLKRLRAKYPEEKFLLTCDRGYECYLLMLWCEYLNIKFCIRGKDIKSTGISKKFADCIDEEGCFDIYRDFKITRTSYVASKKGKELYPEYFYIASRDTVKDSEFNPFIPEPEKLKGRRKGEYKGPLYKELGFRTVRFPLPSSSRKENKEAFEVLFTNLSQDEFSVEELMDLYHVRWGIETCFRQLKYYDSASYMHTKSKQVAINEIITSMVFHNICIKAMILANKKMGGKKEVKKKKDSDKKDSEEKNEIRVWKISYADLSQTIRIYICGRDPTSTKKNIAKELQRTMICERKGRTFTRLIRTQSFIPFIYRAA